MQIALHLAGGLAFQPALELPAALTDVDRRTQFILDIDEPLLVDADGRAQWIQMGKRLDKIAAVSAPLMGDIGHPLLQVSIALRLWSGCISAAKAIALETRSGANTPQGRNTTFGWIDSTAQTDPVFSAGVEAAPSFIRARDQRYDFNGVPAKSPVRRFATGGYSEGT